MTENDILSRLQQVITERLSVDVTTEDTPSYVRSLSDKGIDSILKKIGEESTEVIIAGKSSIRKDIIYESCDLLFHLMILLGHENIELSEINSELTRRFGVSGIVEKSNRSS